MRRFGKLLFLVLSGAAAAPAQMVSAPTPQPQAIVLPASGRSGLGGSATVAQQPVAGATSSVNTLNPSVQVSGPYGGSVAGSESSPFSGKLSFGDAIRRGLAYNLGPVGLRNAARQTKAQEGVARSSLLPNVNGTLSETVQQTNLAALGFRISVPGFHIPTVVGPYNYFDLQVSLSQMVANLTSIQNFRAARDTARAGEYTLKDARDLVVLAVGGAYLQVGAAQARLDAEQAQLDTANAILHRSVEQHAAGVLGKLNVDQNQVRALTEQQRLITLRNDLAKQKINLARLVGLPVSAPYELTDNFAFQPVPVEGVEQAVAAAEQHRPDLHAAQLQVEAAEKAVSAARAERLPSLSVSANYGVIGLNPSQAHNAYAAVGTLNIPVWQGGRASADIAQAEAVLAQRRAELADTRGQIEAQIRQAYLDLDAAAGQVEVARKNLEVAREALDMSRTRMEAGVINTVEVVQAQETVASANLDLINSIFAHNLAKLNLARAMGNAEAQVGTLLPTARP